MPTPIQRTLEPRAACAPAAPTKLGKGKVWSVDRGITAYRPAGLVALVLSLLTVGALTLHGEADLVLLSSWPPDSYYPVGRELTFTVGVTNTGPDPALNVVLTNVLPATFDLNSVVLSQGICSSTGEVVFCEFGDLTNQQGVTLVLTVTPTAIGNFLNRAEVACSTTDPDLANNVVTQSSGVRPPYAYAAAVNVVEGDEGETNATFRVWLEMSSPLPASMRYSTGNRTAQAGLDYVSTNGVLVFPPGLTNQTVDVRIVGDRLYETSQGLAGESFSLYLSSPTNAWFPNPRLYAAAGNILDDDPLPSLSIGNVKLVEGESGASFAEFTVSLSEPSGMTTSFQWGTSNGTALAGQDYGGISSSSTIPAGETNGLLTVAVFGDPTLECDEFFSVTLQNPQNATLAPGQGICRILSDEMLLQLPAGIMENDGTVAAAGQVMIGCGNTSGLTVVFSNAAPDLIALPFAVVIPPGHSNALFDIQVFDDALLNGSRAALIAASAPLHVSTSAWLQVHDNETTALTVEVPAVVEEGSGVHTGWVQSAAAPAVDVTIALSSDDTNSVATPESVLLVAGQTSAAFLLTVPNDFLLDGPATATLTAHVQNWEDGVAAVSVIDLTNLSLTLPAELAEGQWVTGAVYTTAAAPTNLFVSFVASDPTVLSLPAAVEIPAGELSAPYVCQASENGDYLGTRTLIVSARSDVLRTATNLVTVLENDPHHFTLSKVPVSQEAYLYYYDLKLTASDHLGSPLPAFNRSATLTAEGMSGPVKVLPTATLAFSQGVCTQYYYFHSWDNNVRLSVSDSQGHVGQSNPFNIVRPFHHILELGVNDLAWDASRGHIIASVRNYWNSISNTLAFINPHDGKIESTLDIGPSPGRMAISDDSQFLYVSFLASNIVRRLDLATRTVDLEFSLGEYVLLPGYTYPRYVDDMLVQPGNPEVVAISRMRPGVSPRCAGIVIVDHGVERPLTYGNPPAMGPNYIEFGGWPTRLYGYDTQISSFTFHRLNVTSSGVVAESTAALMQGYGLDFTYGNGRIYVSNGQIFNPEAGGIVGSFPNGVAPIPAPDISRVICIRQNGSTADMLQVFSESTLALLHQRFIPGAGGLAASPLRWGDSGVAFRTTGNRVVILQSDYLADLDGNGLPDLWETKHFGAPGTPDGAPENDPDGDGLSNRGEQIAGTDPWDVTSKVEVSAAWVVGKDVQIEVPSLVGRCYEVEKATLLGGDDWRPVEAFPGTGDDLVIIDPGAARETSGFYRVRVFF